MNPVSLRDFLKTLCHIFLSLKSLPAAVFFDGMFTSPQNIPCLNQELPSEMKGFLSEELTT